MKFNKLVLLGLAAAAAVYAQDEEDSSSSSKGCDLTSLKSKAKAEIDSENLEIKIETEAEAEGGCAAASEVRVGCNKQQSGEGLSWCYIHGKVKAKAGDKDGVKNEVSLRIGSLFNVAGTVGTDGVFTNTSAFTKTLDMADFTFAAPECSCSATPTDLVNDGDVECGVDSKALTCSLSAQQTGGATQFEIVFTMPLQLIDDAGQLELNPYSVKYDINIQNAAVASGEYLAVSTSLRTKSKIRDDVEDEERGTTNLKGVAAADGAGAFLWSNTYATTAGGNADQPIYFKAAPVGKGSDGENDKRVYFIFGGQGGNVFWDPELDFSSGLASESSSSTVVASVAMTVAAAAVALFF